MGRVKLTPKQQSLKAWLLMREKIEQKPNSVKEKFYLKEENYPLLHAKLFSPMHETAGTFTSDEAKNRLTELIDELHLWEKKKHRSVLEQACFLHVELYFVRLFMQYNGILARYMTDAFLLANDYESPNWNTSKEQYEESLASASRGNYRHLIDLMINTGCKKRENP